jgi:hypothetical protein
MISFVILSSPARSSSAWISQVELSKVGTGILNFEWAVLPPGSSKEAIPLEATVKQIFPCDLNDEASVLHINVFPVPP